MKLNKHYNGNEFYLLRDLQEYLKELNKITNYLEKDVEFLIEFSTTDDKNFTDLHNHINYLKSIKREVIIKIKEKETYFLNLNK